MPERGDLIDGPTTLWHINSLQLTVEPRDGGLMYKLWCEEALSYRGYRFDLFDQTVAVFDPGASGPVQDCAAGQVVAAGGPVMPPWPFPLQFEVKLRFREEGDRGDLGYNTPFTWDADGKLYYDEK